MERSEPMSVDHLTIELRVHGVSGTPTEETLHDPHPVQVAGDSDTLFVRSARPTTPVEPGLLVESSLDQEPKVERHGRVLEAYHWGSLTAGAATRALYMALIPFLLVNVAYWAVPHATRWEDDNRERVVASTHPLIRATRALIKLFALALSIEFLLASALIFIDVYAWQYGAVAAAQTSPAWYGRILTSGFFAHQVGRPVALGALLCVGLTVFFSLSGKRRWDRPLADAPGADQRRVGPFAHPSFWVKRDAGQGMRQVHVAAMRGSLAALIAAVARADGGSNGTSAFLVAVLTAGLISLAASVVLVAVSEWWPGGRDVPPVEGQFGVFAVLAKALRWFCNVVLAAVLVFVAFVGPDWSATRQAPMPELSGSLWTVAAVQTALAVALGVLLLIVRATRGGSGALAVVIPAPSPAMPAPGDDTPARQAAVAAALAWPDGSATTDDDSAWSKWFRPAAGGLVPLVLVVGAWQVAAAMSAGLAILVARALGTPVTALNHDVSVVPVKDPIVLPSSYWGVSTLWGIGAGALVVFAIVAGLWLWLTNAWQTKVAEEVAEIDPPMSPLAPAPPGSLARDAMARRVGAAMLRGRLLKHHAIEGVVILVSYMALVAVAGALLLPSRPSSGWLKTQDLNRGVLPYVGSWLLVGLTLGLLWLGRSAYKSAAMRRRTGTFFDVACFWPRVAHPFAAPCYGERAVPDLVERVEFLLGLSPGSEEAQAKRPTRVILAGHSQGSLICFTVVMQLYGRHGAEKLERLSLMTYGSQLRWVFCKVFPSYVGYWEQAAVRSDALGYRWRNMYRETDPIGDRVLEATRPPGSAASDQRCTDPQSHRWNTIEGTAALRMHGDYFSSVGYDTAAGELVELMGGTADPPLDDSPPS